MSVQRAGTGRSAEFADSGVDLVETMMYKSFFTANNLMPSTTFKEELNTFPTPDFQNLNGGTFAISMSRAKMVVSGNPANFGWDLGAAKSTILQIGVGMRPRGFGMGFFLSSTLPNAGEIPNNSYVWVWEVNVARAAIYKITAGPTYTLLGSESGVDASLVANSGMAAYYDDATNRLIFLARGGSEQWFPVVDITDTSFTTFRYCGYRWGAGSALNFFTTTPMGIYHS